LSSSILPLFRRAGARFLTARNGASGFLESGCHPSGGRVRLPSGRGPRSILPLFRRAGARFLTARNALDLADPAIARRTQRASSGARESVLFADPHLFKHHVRGGELARVLAHTIETPETHGRRRSTAKLARRRDGRRLHDHDGDRERETLRTDQRVAVRSVVRRDECSSRRAGAQLSIARGAVLRGAHERTPRAFLLL
jgi:hypothetical protein